MIHWLQIIPPLYRELARDLVSAAVQLEVRVELAELAARRNARRAGKWHAEARSVGFATP